MTRKRLTRTWSIAPADPPTAPEAVPERAALPVPARPATPSRSTGPNVAQFAAAAGAVVLVLLGLGIWRVLHGRVTTGAQGSPGAVQAANVASPPAASQGPASSVAIGATTGSGGSAVNVASSASATASATAPDSVDAGGSPVAYPASNVLDGDPRTAWRVAGDGRGVTLTITMPQPVHLTQVGLIPGYAKVDPVDGMNRFTQDRRVAQVRWRFSDGTVVDQRFSDHPTLQRTSVDVTTSFAVVEIVASRPGDPDHDYTPISEVSLIAAG